MRRELQSTRNFNVLGGRSTHRYGPALVLVVAGLTTLIPNIQRALRGAYQQLSGLPILRQAAERQLGACAIKRMMDRDTIAK